jgi:hypothetical protein
MIVTTGKLATRRGRCSQAEAPDRFKPKSALVSGFRAGATVSRLTPASGRCRPYGACGSFAYLTQRYALG